MDKKTYLLYGFYAGEWKLITRRDGRSKAREQIGKALRDVKAYRARFELPPLQMKIESHPV